MDKVRITPDNQLVYSECEWCQEVEWITPAEVEALDYPEWVSQLIESVRQSLIDNKV